MIQHGVKEKVLECKDIHELEFISKQIISWALEEKIWIFSGDLGSGKTTLVKEICKQLGVEDRVSSPSFALINEYQTQNSNKIYHFDFYRLEDEEEVHQLGIDEYFNSGNLCLIEWPEMIPSYLPEERVDIRIEASRDGSRNYYLTRHGSET